VWEGEPRSVSDACIFHGKFRVDDFETPKDAEFYHGVDWGFSHDPTAAVRAFIKDDILFIDREVGGVGVDINETPRMFDAIPTLRSWTSIADSARPETISYMKQNGYPRMKGAKKGKGSIEDGIEKIRGFKEVIIHPRCKETIQEFKLYQYKKNSLTGDVMPIPEDKNNHYIDALRYALEDYGHETGIDLSDKSIKALWGTK
jgi:phage terminase large subunit